MDDVIPFLENVLRGRNVPRERMLQVARHYELFGGVSPINQQNRDLIAALEKEFEREEMRLPIYWGNRNWHPLLPNTLRRMADDGIKNALAFVTSAYSSYSSCRQYLQNISDAQAAVGPEAPRVEKLRVFYKHPLFIEANVDHIRVALAQLEDPHLVCTAHSIPESMAVNCDYVSQLGQTGALIARELPIKKWHMVYQSRSGSPMQPWLGPDVCEHLRTLRMKV
jgi:ferrochelatase